MIRPNILRALLITSTYEPTDIRRQAVLRIATREEICEAQKIRRGAR